MNVVNWVGLLIWIFVTYLIPTKDLQVLSAQFFLTAQLSLHILSLCIVTAYSLHTLSGWILLIKGDLSWQIKKNQVYVNFREN